MRRRDYIGGMAAGLLAGGVQAAGPAQPKIQDVVKTELDAAKMEGKVLALYFHASWCAHCKLFDLLFQDPAAAKIFDAHFRRASFRVREDKAKYKALVLPGAEPYFLKLSGGNIAVPLLAFFGPDGKARGTSLTGQGKNIGFPVEKWELDWFETMLSRAAPEMSSQDIDALRAACVRIYKPRA